MLDLPDRAQLPAIEQRAAVRAALAEVECNAIAHPGVGGPNWWDVQPMLDATRLGPEELAMNRDAIALLLLRGLAQQHPTLPHLLRLHLQA